MSGFKIAALAALAGAMWMASPAKAAAQVSVAAASVAPGQMQQAKIVFPQASGQQAVKLTVTQPDGQPADWLDRVVVTDKQGATVELPMAYNDARGIWTVTATDLFTNRAGVCRFAVK